MAVGIGQLDPTEPGGESSATGIGVAATQTPMGTIDGIVGLLDDSVYYDGYNLTGTILTVTDDATTGMCKLTFTAAIFSSTSRYNQCWLKLTSGANEGTWYQIYNSPSTTTCLLRGTTTLTFRGAAAGTVDIGAIQAYRDFAVMRPQGSMELTGIWVDHEGAEGSASNATMKAQVFTQGLRPRDPMSLVGTTTIDESARNGKWTRLGYDTSPARNKRTSRARLRLVWFVRGTRIKVRYLALRELQWPR